MCAHTLTLSFTKYLCIPSGDNVIRQNRIKTFELIDVIRAISGRVAPRYWVKDINQVRFSSYKLEAAGEVRLGRAFRYSLSHSNYVEV